VSDKIGKGELGAGDGGDSGDPAGCARGTLVEGGRGGVTLATCSGDVFRKADMLAVGGNMSNREDFREWDAGGCCSISDDIDSL
jgi:hypothetical protein